MSDHTRTFISVQFSNEVVSALDRITQDLKFSLGSHTKVKWLKPQNIHLTLQFLGDVSPAGLTELASGLSGAFLDTAPFEIVLTGVGCFPSPIKPRIFWAAIQSGKNQLTALQKRVHQVTKPLGFVPEERPFKPHVTLGRVKVFRDTKKLLAFLDKNAQVHVGTCQISAVHLMASKLEPAGPVYTTLDSFQLGA